MADISSEMEKDLEDLDDDLDDETRSGGSSSEPAKPDDLNDEEWEIKQSIGTDCTLDYEAEEDEYDRVAVGRVKGGDHLYMNDVLDYEIDVDSCNVLPNSFRDVSRDPRANHVAAKFRLKEDAEAATKVDSLQISEKDDPAVGDARISASEDGINPKSILKRKDGQLDPKSQKRVRFDPECKNNCEEESEGAKYVSMETGSAQDFSSAVPDYIRNPSRYTHYTFDSLSDVDEESNRQAYMDFLKLVNRSNPMESSSNDEYEDLPTVTFIPRRKTGNVTLGEDSADLNWSQGNVNKDSTHSKALAIRIAAVDTEDVEVCTMDEDEPETAVDRRNSSQRLNRRYRMKGNLELD